MRCRRERALELHPGHQWHQDHPLLLCTGQGVRTGGGVCIASVYPGGHGERCEPAHSERKKENLD